MIKLNYKEYCLEVPDTVYLPSDDSYLFLDVILEDNKSKMINSALEIGAGSGYVSLGIYNLVNKIILTDINPIVINYLNKLKEKYNLNKIEVISSDLLKNIPKSIVFDVIIFNPPYVPSEKVPLSTELDKLSTDGGQFGRKIIIRFLADLRKHLAKDGCCYLLISSFNNPHYLYKQILKNNLTYKILKERNIFFEKLIVLKIFAK